MGCCSLKRDPAGASWLSVALVCAPLALFGTALYLAVAATAAAVPPLGDVRDSLHCLLRRNAELLNRRFKHLKWRCTLSGVLLRHWPWGSGCLFRTLYPATAAAAWLVALAVLLGGARLAWGGN